MVDSILSRDKNWVRWKLRGCPPIELPPLSAETFSASKSAIQAAARKRPRRHHQPGVMDLEFLQPPVQESLWERYKDPARYRVPGLDTYKGKISDAQFDVGMASKSSEKSHSEAVLSAQTWRAMRIAALTNISALDRVEDYRNAEALFQEPACETGQKDLGPSVPLPRDTRAIVISGPSGSGYAALVDKMMDAKPGVFKLVPRLTTRQVAGNDEARGTFEHADKSEIDAAMDRDQIIEFEDDGEHTIATSRKTVDQIRASEKVPLMCLGISNAKSVKEWDYDARFVFAAKLQAEAKASVEQQASGEAQTGDDTASPAPEAEEQPGADEVADETIFDLVLPHGSLDSASAELVDFVYRAEPEMPETETHNGEGAENPSA